MHVNKDSPSLEKNKEQTCLFSSKLLKNSLWKINQKHSQLMSVGYPWILIILRSINVLIKKKTPTSICNLKLDSKLSSRSPRTVAGC